MEKLSSPLPHRIRLPSEALPFGTKAETAAMTDCGIKYNKKRCNLQTEKILAFQSKPSVLKRGVLKMEAGCVLIRLRYRQ